MTSKIKLLLASVAIFSICLCLFVTLTFEKRGHYTGDGDSNRVVLISGKNFEKFGFAPLKYTPLQVPVEKIPAIPVDPKNPIFYLHYPSGMDMFQGFLYKLGLESVVSHQLFALFISFLGAFFALKTLLLLFDPWVAAVAWSVFVLAPNFIFFADSLHQHSYFFLIKWSFFFLISKLYKSKQSTDLNFSKWILSFFALGFAGSLFSLDLVPPTLILGMALPFCVAKEKRWTAGLFLMLAAPLGEIIGFVFQLYKNSFVLGTFSASVRDFFNIYEVRTGETALNFSSQYDFTRHMGKWFLGQQWFFTWPLLLVALLGWVREVSKKELFWQSLFVASLIGTFFWVVFMKQHSMIHAFTYRHTEILAVIGLALFLQNSSRNHWTLWGMIFISFMFVHSVLAVTNVEGTALKGWAINMVLPDNSKISWACVQAPRLQNATELRGAKEIVGTIIGNSNCTEANEPAGARGHIAETILFWR